MSKYINQPAALQNDVARHIAFLALTVLQLHDSKVSWVMTPASH